MSKEERTNHRVTEDTEQARREDTRRGKKRRASAVFVLIPLLVFSLSQFPYRPEDLGNMQMLRQRARIRRLNDAAVGDQIAVGKADFNQRGSALDQLP